MSNPVSIVTQLIQGPPGPIAAVVTSVANLVASPDSTYADGTLVFVTATGSRALWRLDKTTTIAADGVTAIATLSGVGKWVLNSRYTGIIPVTECGAYGDGIHDDAPAIQSVVNAVAAFSGHVYLPPGNFALKSKQGANGEFIVLGNGTSHIRIFGAGIDKTTLTVGNGFNTVGNGGWSCVFGNCQFTQTGGRNTYTATLNHVWAHDFTVDCNAANNLWQVANFGGLQEPGIFNSAVAVFNGDDTRVERVYVKNHNGVSAIQVGQYITPSALTDVAVVECRVDQYADPNIGDASLIRGAFARGTVNNCTVNGPATAFGLNNAYEFHSIDMDFGQNIAYKFNGALTIAGDFQDGVSVRVHDCVFTSCTIGVSLFSGATTNPRKLQKTCINDCVFEVYDSAVACDSFSDGSTQGYYDTTIADNTMWLISGFPSNAPAINIIGQVGGKAGANGGGMTIRGNRIFGWAAGGATSVGIKLNLLVTTDNMDGVVIADNELENVGKYGIYITGPAGSASAQYTKLKVRNNTIKDTQASPTLVDGIHVDGFTDNTCDFVMNAVHNFSNADLAFNTANYSMNAGCIIGLQNGALLEARTCVSGTISNIFACYLNSGTSTWFATGPLMIDQTTGSTIEWRYATGQQLKVSNGATATRMLLSDTVVEFPVVAAPASNNAYISTDPNGIMTANTVRGATGSRPGSPFIGQMFFDTSLNIPIWYKGASVWINASGSTV